MPRSRLAAIVAVIALATLPPAASAAEADAPPACGDEVATDLTLTADLTCAGTALTVVADDVTIDLGGHTIEADEVLRASDVDGLVVRDGALAGGWLRTSGTELEVTGVRFSDAEVRCAEGDIVATRNRFRSSALIATYCPVVIERNRFEEGRIAFQTALGGTVRHNTFHGGETGMALSTATELVVERNHLSGFRTVGIDIGGGGQRSGGRSVVRHNVVAASDVGIRFGGESLVVGAHATIAGNLVAANRRHGIEVVATVANLRGPRVTVEGNRAVANGADGIRVEVRRDGVAIEEHVELAGNRAVANAGLGMHVDEDPMIVDGGGNVAVANRDRRQCVGIPCNAPGHQEPATAAAG